MSAEKSAGPPFARSLRDSTRAAQRAGREFDSCMKQAEGIADTRGVDAASAHMDWCVDELGRNTLVE